MRDRLGEQLAVVVDGLLGPNRGYSLRRALSECGSVVKMASNSASASTPSHVLLDQHLEQALLADPAHVVAGVALAVVEQAGGNGVVQDLRHAP